MKLYIFYKGSTWLVVLTLLITLQVILRIPNLKADTFSEPLHPLPEVKLNPSKVELGKRLFHDQRLSGDNSVSCASCHNLKTGGVDRLRVSKGVRGAEGGINAPTVFNSGFNFSQFWDGRGEP
ncbi:MAG: hypothetical protein ETSY1_35430 [Candidatus Entotheonella factor]|uniref:Di-haem cytochrome c peroxidase domain-containing protein n=1 Tax=Entotheonella factor TaxID=1429438 RepID=W4L8I4_ENTF1|nr:MAG: hypothetical protein ETSY1_35430 [Candidatus Entotheonella factor]